jgi:FtsZ-binding cell division protein ZapB
MAFIGPEASEKNAELDTLGHLEQRIQKAVALVTRLREERDEAITGLAAARVAGEEASARAARFAEELEALRAERQQVRNRLERLLGHIDQLGAS